MICLKSYCNRCKCNNHHMKCISKHICWCNNWCSSKLLPKLPAENCWRCNHTNCCWSKTDHFITHRWCKSCIHNICSMDNSTISNSKVCHWVSKWDHFQNRCNSNIFICTISGQKQCNSDNSWNTSWHMVCCSILSKFNRCWCWCDDVCTICIPSMRHNKRSTSDIQTIWNIPIQVRWFNLSWYSGHCMRCNRCMDKWFTISLTLNHIHHWFNSCIWSSLRRWKICIYQPQLNSILL